MDEYTATRIAKSPNEYGWLAHRDAFTFWLNRERRVDKRTKRGKEKASEAVQYMNVLRPYVR